MQYNLLLTALLAMTLMAGCSSSDKGTSGQENSSVSNNSGSIMAAVDAVTVSKKVDDQPSLFVLLGKDGSINRIGSGSINNTEKDMFIGVTKEPLFQRFMDSVPEKFIEAQRQTLGAPGEHRGKNCQILLTFQSGKHESGLTFVYGSESQGPPPELSQVVARAIEVTEPWYQSEKKMVSGVKK